MTKLNPPFDFMIPGFVIDNRSVLPDFVESFVKHSLQIMDLHLMAPAAGIRRPGDVRGSLRIHGWEDLEGASKLIADFDAVFENFSTNDASFERACFIRWGLMLLMCHELQVPRMILLDSDQILGISASELFDWSASKLSGSTPDIIGALGRGTGQSISVVHQPVIASVGALQEFWTFLLTDYFSPARKLLHRDEFRQRLAQNLAGGICDMTALAAFVSERHQSVVDLAECELGRFIGNLSVFAAQHGDRNWRLLKHGSHVRLEIDGKSERVLGIHFQGEMKLLLPEFIRTGVTSGSDVRRLTRRLSIRRRLSHRWHGQNA